MDNENIKKRIDLINEAISRNVHSVKFDQKEIVYRSLDEMLKAREIFKSELNKGKSRSKRISAVFSRGL
jgi:hypothetical protein